MLHVNLSQSVADSEWLTTNVYSMKKEIKDKKLHCDFCSRRFKKGGTRCLIKIEIVSDFNGHLEDWSKKPDNYL